MRVNGVNDVTTNGELFERKKSAKQLVEEFELTAEVRAWAAQEAPSVPVDAEIEAWRDRCREGAYKRGKGIPIADAAASFRTACRNAEAWGVYRKMANLRVLKKAPTTTAEPSDVTRQLMLRGGRK